MNTKYYSAYYSVPMPSIHNPNYICFYDGLMPYACITSYLSFFQWCASLRVKLSEKDIFEKRSDNIQGMGI